MHWKRLLLSMVPLCLYPTAHSACSVDSKKVGVYLDEVLVENFVLNFGRNHEARESLVACAKTTQFESAAVAPTASILLSVASCWVNADPEVSRTDQRQTYYMRRRIMHGGRGLRFSSDNTTTSQRTTSTQQIRARSFTRA